MMIRPAHRETVHLIARMGWVTPVILAGERHISLHASRQLLRELAYLDLAEQHEGAEPGNPNYRLTCAGRELAAKGWR